MTLRRSLPLVAFAALTIAAPAQASPTLASYDRALAVVADYWHASPSCGRPDIALDAAVPAEIPAAGAWVWPDRCAIHYLDTPANDWGTDWQGFCTITAHEWGHLLGYGHSPDPGSIMFGGSSLIPPVGCRPAGQPAAAPVARVRSVHHAHRHHRRHATRLRGHR